jgi:cysteinyl-tRNA synthetase
MRMGEQRHARPNPGRLVVLSLWLALALVACAKATPQPSEPDWLGVNDFLYQLQRARPERIGETAFDLLVLSIGAAGGSREVVEKLKHSPGGEKIVLCYMSIGQAEDYRFYWQREWYQDPPAWLDEPDPEWAGDYWVRYWDPEWQAIIYGSPESYLDRILALGFDGVYLDRVDTYEYYAEQGRETAAREMADFVIAMARYARERHPGLGVFPQNAEGLGLRFPDYLETVTGIGVEDLYYGYPRDHTPSPPAWTAAREAALDEWVAAGKLVLTVDYTARPEQIADAVQRARARGYVPYVTDRSLGRLRINPGFEPD